MDYLEIREFGEIVTGKTPKTDMPEYWGGDVPFITPTDIPSFDTKYLYSTERNISELGVIKHKNTLLPADTLCVSCIATIGKMCLTKKPSITNQQINSIKVNNSFNPHYLLYLFRYYLPYLQMIGGGTGSGTPIINKGKFSKLKYPVHKDLETQNKIAAVLSSYDELIENNNKRIKLLEQMAENLYKEWFVRFRFPGYKAAGFENGLPKGWKVKKVKDAVKRFPFGKLYKEADVISEGKIIVIDQSKEPYIGFHNDEPSYTANVDAPIILFGDHSCKFQLMITPFSLSENVVPFTATKDIDTTYLYYLVKDLIETTEYKRHWTELVSKKILLADYDIQKQFSQTIKNNLLLIESLKVQNRNLIKQRDLLLPRLMSGKLEV